MRRALGVELMDQPGADEALLAQSLADLAWVNRYLGGSAAVLGQLRRLLTSYGGERLSVLDVGAGGGDILRAVRGMCESRGLAVRSVALDFAPGTTRVAAANAEVWGMASQMRVVRGNALRLPFATGSFDVACCSTTLHHLTAEQAVEALREIDRVSRHGAVVSDLRRGVASYVAVWILANTLWRRHPYARHDGPVSMRSAFTVAEARGLARRAGLDVTIEPRVGFRWAMRWEKRET